MGSDFELKTGLRLGIQREKINDKPYCYFADCWFPSCVLAAPKTSGFPLKRKSSPRSGAKKQLSDGRENRAYTVE